MMNDWFGDLPGVLIYFDDFLIPGETEEEILANLRQVFVRCHLHDLKLQLKKCKFFLRELPWLGHVVRQGTLKPDPLKTPAGPTQGRRSMGFGEPHQMALHQLKSALLSLPVLRLFDHSLPLVVSVDASPSFRSASPVRPSAVPQQSPYNPTRRRNDVSQTMSSRRDWLTYHNTITYVPPMTITSDVTGQIIAIGRAVLDRKRTKAVRLVKIENWRIVRAAREFNLNERTLARYCASMEEADIYSDSPTPAIFSVDEEAELVAYIKKVSDIYFGLIPIEVRKVAYNYADHLKLKILGSWETNFTAGKDWLESFIKRNPIISIRKPEANALSSEGKTSKHKNFKTQ
ncbi:Cytochrome c oxidase subunit IV-like protein [Daphnia magna]|uniref:Cytochrome c oxidase subunit IV-like protein n=1 Tax=Daphnia magna TaxID=35525 RepID=A0A162RLZ6_9CRUS|nr:Cytochrome c oxidase subunit IV-like protein [Daphnia magna]